MENNNVEKFNHGRIITTDVSKEMRTSFLDYSMSVIVSRALPDVRDGLKPVHRRILYSMNHLGMTSDRPHKKSARIVGDVIGKYHPHGDSAVYETMVRMSQPFSFRYPLIDGHGNFGSIDGDGAAAMRYTEARMSKIASEILKDIDKETVDWQDNYDGEEQEPVVLPAKFPNLLVNGTTGIAVGMATNIPPHNLKECIDATIAIMDNPEITAMEIMEDYMHGPDFPTGAFILGRSGIKKAYESGRGSVIMRAKTEIDIMKNGKPRIIVSEIPYMVNKANLVEKIASLVRDKHISGITDLRDESNLVGIRIVIELRKDIQPEVILNQLFRMTALQSTFGVNSVVLVKNRPMLLGVVDILKHYIDHQIDVTVRKTNFELKKAQARAHILEGLKIALDYIDEILKTIRASKDAQEALPKLIENFNLSEIQAKAILDMQFKRLTGLERQKIDEEHQGLVELITDLNDILSNHDRVLNIIKEDLINVKEKYGDDRRSKIIDADFDMQDEDLIPVEDIVVARTTNGYIKRITSDTYKVQNRGGKGIKGMSVNDDDIVDQVITMSTHDSILIFTNVGKVYRIKGYQVPEASRTSKGVPIVNLVSFDKDETVRTIVPVKKDNEEINYLFFVTQNGIIKKVSTDHFERINQNGKIAIKLKEDDELVMVKQTTGQDEIVIAASNGRVVRFKENTLKETSRIAMGVKGINTKGSKVIGIATSNEGKTLLVVSENGYGKKTDIDEYRLAKRGAVGVYTLKITNRNGPLVAFKAVNGDEDCIIMTDNGITIRINLDQVANSSRNTQGVKMINTAEDSIVSTVAIIPSEEEKTELNNDQNKDSE
ncbi:MAG: DNA gyrase subunit A [Anaerorhabdus sp.]